MKKITLSLMIGIFSFFSANIQAQESSESQNSLNSGTIDSQFEYIYDASNNYQEYKVVKKSNLDKLRSNMLDSMRTMRAEVMELKTQLTSKNDSISSLNQVLDQTEAEKQEAIEAKDNFSIFGIAIHKAVYSSLMWLLVGGLGIALAFFSFQYFRSFKKIRKAQKDLEEVQEEFDQHRKNTLERERKLKRELIDAQMGKD